jgi:hypothetical protein
MDMFSGVDVPVAKEMLEIGERAEGKLCLDVGFPIRDCYPFVELVKRVPDGALGNIVWRSPPVRSSTTSISHSQPARREGPS